MSTRAKRITLGKGDVLIREGGASPAIYVLLSGRAEVYKRNRAGEEVLIGHIEPGEVVGEMAIIDDQPHMATVIACEETYVAVMSRDQFLHQLEATDLLVRGIVEAMARRLRSAALRLTMEGF
ncbi:MAG: Crp/Fnr family transcriptional regulator [Solirubrobacterales bacterium]